MPDPRRLAKPLPPATAAIIDDAIRHAVDIEALKQYLVRKLGKRWNDEVMLALVARLEVLLPRIRERGRFSQVQARKQLSETLIVSREIVRAGLATIAADLGNELRKVAVAEAQVAIKQIQSAYPIQVDLKSPPIQTLRASVGKSLPDGRAIPKWVKGIEESTMQKVERTIRLGLAEGKSTQQITRSLRGTRDLGYADGILVGPRHQVSTLTRTAVQNTVTDARELTFKENSDIVSGVRLIAVLDSRTTLICASEDQNVYPIGSGPRPPLHPNCRTTAVPELKSPEELGLDIKPEEPGRRAALGAKGGTTVPSDFKFRDFFERQPEKWKREFLGKGRYDLYKNKGVAVDRFVNDNRRVLTIEQIKAREGIK